MKWILVVCYCSGSFVNSTYELYFIIFISITFLFLIGVIINSNMSRFFSCLCWCEGYISTRALLIFLMSAFTDKNSTITQSNSVRAVFLTSYCFLVTFSYWFKFDVNIIIVSRVSFIRDWLEICKLETSPSEFCPISGNWGNLGIPNLTKMFLMKFYCICFNGRRYSF